MSSTTSEGLNLYQVAKFIAADNMKGIISKLIFLQTKHSLSEAFIEEAKDVALASLMNVDVNRPNAFGYLKPSLVILAGIISVNILIQTFCSAKICDYLTSDERSRMSYISSLHGILATVNALTFKLTNESNVILLESGSLIDLCKNLYAQVIQTSTIKKNTMLPLVKAIYSLSSMLPKIDNQIREQRFFLPDRQILNAIKQIKSDILRKRRVDTFSTSNYL